jgi:hypothetical protein
MVSNPRIPNGLKTATKCRVCGKPDLDPILSLGMQYLSNFVDDSAAEQQQLYCAPLDLALCSRRDGGCGLLQLMHTVPGDLLYRKFWYKSGTNQTMKDALGDIVKKARALANPCRGDIVVDIGANDGTLLRCYGRDAGLRLVGFEPAANLVDEARVGTTKIINDFFNHPAFAREFGDEKAKIVTSIAMFYDLDDPNTFVADIAKILDKDGVWVIQMNYLATMLENNAFDNIVHEHLEYYSLLSLEYLLDRHHLAIFDLEVNDINGGSIRTYVRHKSCQKYPVSQVVDAARNREKKMGLEDPKTYHDFAQRIRRLKDDTLAFVENEVKNGKSFYAYGASTRGNTLLQYYGLTSDLIRAAADRNPAKWGKKTAGTFIPIVSEEQARRERPDYFFVLPWYFAQEFVIREKEFLGSGGKLVFPLPNLRVVSG